MNKCLDTPIYLHVHVFLQLCVCVHASWCMLNVISFSSKHEHANEARKLSKHERRAKKIKKLYEDAAKGIHVCVFRVKDLRNQSNKFKVDMNAQQLHLTGCGLLYNDINVVVAEGGTKALKKYKKLMLHRIKWTPDMIAEGQSNFVTCTCISTVYVLLDTFAL